MAVPPAEGRNMDCKTARLMLEFAHPRHNELDPPDLHPLEAHVTACPECSLNAHKRASTNNSARPWARWTFPISCALAQSPEARTQDGR